MIEPAHADRREHDPVSILAACRRVLADLYENQARDMAEIGEPRLEALYRALAAESGVSMGGAAEAAEGRTPLPAAFQRAQETWVRTPARLRTPYDVWAFAVANETALFEAAVELASQTKDPTVRRAVMTEAHDCLETAARYRGERRTAYHAERLGDEIARFPDIKRIDGGEDLAHVALAIEQWFLTFLDVPRHAGDAVKEAERITRAAIALVADEAEHMPPSKRLERPLRRLTMAKAPPDPEGEAARWLARACLEAERIFDYYDAVFGAANDEALLHLSQRLSAHALSRLQALRAARGAR